MQTAITTADWNFNKRFMWDMPDKMPEFAELVKNPPIHSVVATIGPAMAKAILDAANDRNRPLNKGTKNTLGREIESGQYEVTGDTIKFSSKGRLIDGQHRLSACVDTETPITTHVVFGLDEAVFDILDRQRTRTAADVLSIAGVKQATIVAGATRWVLIISKRRATDSLGGERTPSPRKTRELIAGPMKDLGKYTSHAEEIRKAYHIPPTLSCGFLFCIAQNGGAKVAHDFAEDGLHGNRNYTRNKNFDVLSSRIATIKAQNNGHLQRNVLAAMMVQCFNHWNANIVAAPRAIAWTSKVEFPAIVHDGAEFRKYKGDLQRHATPLPEVKARVMKSLIDVMDDNRRAEASNRQIAKAANVHLSQVGYLLAELARDNLITLIKKPGPGSIDKSVYQILLPQDAQAKVLA